MYLSAYTELEPEKEIQAQKEQAAKQFQEAGKIAGKTILWIVLGTIAFIWWAKR